MSTTKAETERCAGYEPVELVLVFHALRAARDGILGIYNQPRGVGASRVDILEDEMTRLDEMMEAISNIALDRMPEGEDRDEHRFDILLHTVTVWDDATFRQRVAREYADWVNADAAAAAEERQA